jgi:LmbE family N-acetylglucosaminyl deacetylase
MTAPADPAPLPPLDEDWTRALAVVAHPDDLEFGTAAAIARWTGQGKTVVYCLVTSGEAGIDGIAPEQAAPLREQEQRESARLVGVEDVRFLGRSDGVLTYGVELRELIAEQIRQVRPDVVITGNFRDTWDGKRAYNQADHIAVGRATFDAIRDAANRWIFRSQVEAGLEPWPGVRALLAAGSPEATHAVDTTDTFAVGVASLEAHRAYLDGLNWPDFDAEEFLEGFGRRAGSRLGTRTAASFEVFDF